MFYLIHKENTQDPDRFMVNLGQTTLGRDSVNDIYLNDRSISRNHCILTCTHDRLLVLDLNSTNGTRVNNGNRIKQAVLHHGDELRCGNVRFLVSSMEPRTGPPCQTSADPGIAAGTVVIDESDALSRNAFFQDASSDEVFARAKSGNLFDFAKQADARDLESISPAQQIQVRHVMSYLHVFKQISDSLGMASDPEVLLNKALEVIFEVLEVENGVVVLIDPDSGERRNAAVLSSGHQGHIEISQSVINHALNTLQGVMVSDAQDDAGMSENRSVQILNLRSVMCAPLIVRNSAQGALYIDNRSSAGCFSTDDLSLLVSIANMLAVFLDSSLLFRKLNKKIDLANEDLRQQSELLQIYNERLRTVMNAIDDAVLVVDPDGMVVMSNDVATSLFGMLMGESFQDLPCEALVRYLEEMLSSGEKSTCEVKMPHKPQEIVLRASISRTFNQQGDVSGLVCTLSDVSRYREVDDLKNEFIGNVSHELRAPLTSILGYAMMMKQTPDLSDADREEFMGIIQSEAERLNCLVNDLLDVSRIEQNRVELEITREQPALILDHVLKSGAIKAQSKEILFHVDLEDAPPAMLTDSDYLKQALTNVVDNAIKYTPEKGQVVVACSRDADNVVFTIRDNGIGISPEDQKQLFQKFFRASGEYMQKVTGTGLGLYITQRLVHMLDGRIDVQSAPGEGSTFTITMPLAPAVEAQE